jgi:plasmid stability protein
MLKIAILTALALGATCAAQTRLSLTDSQRQNLSNMRQQHRQSTEASMREIRGKELALREQIRAGNTDAATLGRMLIDLEASRKQVAASRKTLREQMVLSLTAEQQTRLKSLEDARNLAPAIREAESLGLLDTPEPPVTATGGERIESGPRPFGPRGARLGEFRHERRFDQ